MCGSSWSPVRRGFCAGMDADSLAVSAGGVKRVPGKGRQMTHAVTIAKPVIAAVNGPCAGLGLVQALACDIRFMAASAVLTTSFTRRGLNAEYGASWLLPRIIGQTRAAELLLSGRRVDAAEAERIGLVNWVVPDAEYRHGRRVRLRRGGELLAGRHGRHQTPAVRRLVAHPR